MNIQLHKNARTPPAIRLELQSQPESVSDRALAEAYHLNRHTVAKWRQRKGVEDASHRPQRLHGLHRHDVSNLETLMPWEAGAKMPMKPVKAYDPGCVHVDVKYLPHMPDEDHRQYRFAAIDRATRWVYVERLQDKSAASAGGFLSRLIDKAPFTITKVLTDNGKEFTDRFCATGQRQPTGAHAFDRVCTANRSEHRLTKPRTPQTSSKGLMDSLLGLLLR